MSFRYEVRLAGSGGQGLILASIILADATGIHDGRYVAQTQSYGPEARGGASKAEVIISDEEIDYPKARRLDFLLAMNQKSCDEYYKDIKPDGFLLVDSTFVNRVPTEMAGQISFTQIARERLGREFVANIMSLGALTRISGIVSSRAMEASIQSHVPPGSEMLNLQAFKVGMSVARKIPRLVPPWKRHQA
ncbi:MAG: 2-oxoacid:acceptor oxidoreductase family protein [Deltaproteobacteria bacterium]|nr:2-oxoacid:acceptor oxidoreductase family protein [Deltaproteobacteria bacterium]MBW2307885.1 2-oxoacid:acceptor oxidoreductase family protein [Deltaproteobacteria bacterium]